MTTIRRTFKYRMYENRRNKHLHCQIDVAGIIWNHCVALQRRYYRLTGGYIHKYRLMKHIAKLRMQTARFAYWQIVGSQANCSSLTARLVRIAPMNRAGPSTMPTCIVFMKMNTCWWSMHPTGKKILPTWRHCAKNSARWS